MTRRTDRKLSRRERQIMDIVYRSGRVSAAEVREELPDPPSYSTVRTLLRILEDKGHLRHEQEGPRYVVDPDSEAARRTGERYRWTVDRLGFFRHERFAAEPPPDAGAEPEVGPGPAVLTQGGEDVADGVVAEGQVHARRSPVAGHDDLPGAEERPTVEVSAVRHLDVDLPGRSDEPEDLAQGVGSAGLINLAVVIIGVDGLGPRPQTG